MRSFRRFFALLFITATLFGALHELIHDHEHKIVQYEKDEYSLSLIANTPLVLSDPLELSFLEKFFISILWSGSSRIDITRR
jgi:hypothetical protein